MNVCISADMDGIAGVVAIQRRAGTGSYERFRHIMTRDVNAAVQGALDGGGQSVVVADGHGPMTNILIEELHEAAELISGNNRSVTRKPGSTRAPCPLLCRSSPAGGGTGGVLSRTKLAARSVRCGSMVSRPMNRRSTPPWQAYTTYRWPS